tara:strand:+ start:407 stop:736 length:330 start_codon:yes stop_codon:yes gene_type:complete
MDFLDKFKYKKSEFPDLDYEAEKIVYGKLKMLEDLAVYIDTMRESLTRHLVVSGANDCETDEDFKERWSGVKGLDGSVEDCPNCKELNKNDSENEEVVNEALTTKDLLI